MSVCKCERCVPADILKIHTRHFNFKGMELQTARDGSHLCYCDACMQLKLCVFHDESVRLMEFVILLSPPPSTHRCSFVVGTGPPNIQAIQPASVSPTHKISTWTLPQNQTTNVKYKPEFIFKTCIHKRLYRTSVIKYKSIRGFKIFLKSILKNTLSDMFCVFRAIQNYINFIFFGRKRSLAPKLCTWIVEWTCSILA